MSTPAKLESAKSEPAAGLSEASKSEPSKSTPESKLFESLKAIGGAMLTVAPGLETLWPEGKAELKRLATQGAMELASVLFNGSGFVPYGPGQYTPDHDTAGPSLAQVLSIAPAHENSTLEAISPEASVAPPAIEQEGRGR